MKPNMITNTEAPLPIKGPEWRNPGIVPPWLRPIKDDVPRILPLPEVPVQK